ncbi:collagen-binding protein [Prevotella sp. S7-1-8]|uniref:SusC/RagA family TonB-linked outer membrane protein n=1 Tax=Prevotella sp. S7-1-8 TaxID=1284775 RepID=UPI00050ECA3B|nr:TonB-dependent receptor [Prevotella sp. S7-1-8]KGF17291.1 collagen-binding protein [Prevotella sp. S7-1-8]
METSKSNVHLRRVFLCTAMSLTFLAPVAGVCASNINALVPAGKVAQDAITVSGTVSDALEPMIGATVMEKGTTNGTVTDIDGHFTIKVSSPNAKLVISSVGYVTQEIKVGSRRNIRVTLKEDDKSLNEVVVVGYGTQKKVNMTGSVSAVNVAELAESRPITNVSQALAGMAAGVSVRSNNNQPGNDNASILVRGQGTLNSSAPLVIIDGAEAGINTVNPQDIESVSILKDAASAAIYGSRAANGVILITTKKGKAGKVKVDYNGYVSFESIRKTLTPVSDYATYMELINEGYVNSKKAAPFTEDVIKEWRDDGGKNPLKYPNTNWIDETFKPAVATNHVVSVSGGSDKVRFYGSFGYLNNPGVMANAGFSKCNGRLSVDADVTKWLSVGMQISGYVSDMQPGVNEIGNVFTYTAATTPGMVFKAPDGRFGAVNNTQDASQSSNNNPLIRAYSWKGDNRKNNFHPRFTATIKPARGLSLALSYSYEFLDHFTSRKPVFLEGWNFLTEMPTFTNKRRTTYQNYNGKTERYFNDAVLRYDNKFFKKSLAMNFMVGASQELYRFKSFSASKQDMIDLSMDALDGTTGQANAGGSRTEWAMRSFFTRLNLNWQEKYLFEFNLRADGSSRFQSNKRWGYFPSASAAWRIDQERFMEGAFNNQLSNLKVRVSYGALGNNAVGNYDSQSLYTTNKNEYNYVLGNSMVTGLAKAALANPLLTWESTNVFDAGLDFGFFNNRLTGTIDYFNKRTTDILINLPAPGVHGTTSLPKSNSAIVTNNGFEFTLGWQDKTQDFTYGATANLTYVTNKVNKFKGTDKGGMAISGANLIWEGHSINSQYLLRVDRILQTDEDMKLVQRMIDNAPIGSDGKKVNPFAAFGKPEKGDLFYKDVNNDGIIDNTDKEIVSDGPNHKVMLGLNLNAGWRGFDLAVLTQGAFGGKMFWRTDAYNTPSVRRGYQLNKEVVEGRWYEGRTDATYPRLLEYGDRRNLGFSDFFLQDLSFVKIRNIQLGYSLPKALVGKLGLGRVRVYGSLENFFTFTKYKGFDPEVSGMAYPSMKQAVFGLNVSF